MPGKGGLGIEKRKAPFSPPLPEKLLGLFYYATLGPGSNNGTSFRKMRGAPADVWFWGDRSEAEGWVSSCGPPGFSRRYLLRICT